MTLPQARSRPPTTVVADVLTLESRQQCTLVRLERLAQARELVDTRVVGDSHRKRLEQRLRCRLVRGSPGRRPADEEHHADRTGRPR